MQLSLDVYVVCAWRAEMRSSRFEPLEARRLLSAAIDSIVFGNAASEQAHSFSSTFTQTISGALGQSARQALPHNPVDIYGGDMTFNMSLDPLKRNYFTIKLWGGDDTDSSKGRLYLYIPLNGTDYQVGYRHEGDYAPLSVTADQQPLPGRFFYSTTVLPLAMTRGKTSLALKIVSTGELYGLGSGGPPSGNYQFNMTINSRGIYRAYTHTQPMLDVSGEVQGAAPATTTRPSPTEASVLGPTGTYTLGINNWINGRLSAAVNAFTATDVELLARSFTVSQLSNGYQNPAIVSKIIAVIDGFATDYYTNPATSVTGADNYGAAGGNEVWGGRFGALGWAIHLLSRAGQLPDSVMNAVNAYGAGGSVARRQAWGDMLGGSRDYGRFSRDGRYLTNQALIADTNIYKANRGMLDIGAANAMTETAARRYLKEAIGLEPWRGSDLPAGGSSFKYGTNYFQVTPKGLTKEWGYPGGYGEMQYFAATFYQYTGDAAFRDQAVKILKARAPFRRPAIEIVGANMYRSVEREGILAWRGVREADGYFSDEINYGDPGGWSQGMAVAGRTLDPTAVGYAKQMLADNQYFSQLVADPRYYSSLTFDARFAMEVWDDYNAVKTAADSGIRLPMTDGQADFAFTDEQDGIAAIKHGNERLWIEPLWQAKEGTGINGIGRFHYSTPSYDQYGTFETSPQFDFSGSYFVRPFTQIDGPATTQYSPPDPPTQAYGGEKLPIGNELSAHDDTPFRGRAAFWGFRFGSYLLGMNASSDTSYQLKTPLRFVSAPDLLTGATRSGTITVAPNTSIILYLDNNTDAAPVPTAPLLLTAAGSAASINLNWSDASGATNYNVKRSLTSHGPYITIADNMASTSFSDPNVTPGSTYYYVVSAVNENGESYNSGQTLASAGLPSPWLNQDIGTVVLPGSSNYNSSTGGFTLTASGSSIGGTSDSFQFAYLPITGNATIIVHVAGMMNASGQDRAGVMMRESLAPDSRFAAILFEDGGNVRLTRRTTTGGAAATSGNISNTWAPGWMKLERVGNTFNAYLSADGVTWGSPFSSQTFTMNAAIFIGLATTSRTNSQLVASTFDHVQVMPVKVIGGTYPYLQAPNLVRFTFTADVSSSLQPADLQLINLDGGIAPPQVQSVSFDPATLTATFTLSGSLPPDGNYRATLPAVSVADSLGNHPVADFSFDFFAFSGDANHDRVVDVSDLGIVATNWQSSGRTFAEGDFNYDRVVDVSDLGILATNWQKSLAAAVPGTLSLSAGGLAADNRPALRFFDAHRDPFAVAIEVADLNHLNASVGELDFQPIRTRRMGTSYDAVFLEGLD
jgi:hypothetical protein